MSALRWAILVLVAICLGVGGGVGAHAAMPRSPYAKGLFVGDELLPPASEVGSWIDRRRSEVKARRVNVLYEDKLLETTYDELGVDLDIGATLEQAKVIGHRGGPWTRLAEGRSAARGEISLPLVYRFNEAKANELLDRVAAEVRADPVDAKMDLKNRRKIPDVPGRGLAFERSLESLRSADYDLVHGTTIRLTVLPVRARVSLTDLVDVDVSKVLSAYETTFATYGVGVGRTVNITRAAASIDGAIIPPGYTFSFNELVGPRTLERGFTWAPEIQADELTTGVGGGTCQVSSTLFGAALFGALDIVDRQSHSRPSAYAKFGLDATVVFPAVDLKIKNPFSFPLMIHAYHPANGTLRVEILGGEPTADVTYAYGIGSTSDFMRRITVKSFLEPGKRIRRQKGSRGYDVGSVVTIKWRDGRIEERRYFSGYRPAPEVFWVAPGYDEKELPPLPEHAIGVEGRDGYTSSL